MDLLKNLLEAHGGKLAQQVAGQAGIDPNQASSAIAELLPSLAQGMQSNIAKPGGLESLLGAIQSGNHQRYIDNPSELGAESAVQDGNGILGHLLGSKDVSRQVAARAAERTGIDPEKFKSLLPIVASAMMGSVSKKVGGAGIGGGLSNVTAALEGIGGQGAIGAILGQFLGADDAQRQPAPQVEMPQPQIGTPEVKLPRPETPQKKGGGLFGLARKLFK